MLFSAPRRLCAPSSLLLGIIASLLFFDPHAYAQGPSGYGTPVYTGGTAVTGTPISKYRLNSGSDVWLYSYGLYGQTETGSAIGTVSCKGDLTATFTWPSGVGPTPPAVIIEQQAEVLWNGYTGVTGSAFNPLNQVSPGVGVDCVAIKYSGQSATASVPLPASLTVVLSGLTATATPPVPPYPGGTGVIRASYQASIFPVTLNLVGATKDSSGNYNILVGQGCTASLSGIPAGCTVSNYQWSVTGTTFQSWTADNSHTTEVDGPGPLTNPTASWFWDDQKTAQDKVTCTVTVTPPSGQGLPFSLTVVKPVNVVVPSWTCTGTAGTMQVNTLWGAGNGTDSCLWAGPASGSAKSVGMDWNATLSPLPAPFSGTGTLELVQTETPNSTYISTAGAKYKRSNNGQQGLDTFYPYPWVQSPSPL